MSKNEREWTPNFIEYMEFIVNHENYQGLPIERKPDGSLKWVVTKTTSVGQQRLTWCENKAKELGYSVEPGVYAKVMREIHPTKTKVCQTCGRSMSIYYFYPNASMIKAIFEEFKYECDECTHINDIWDDLISLGLNESILTRFFANKVGFSQSDTGTNKEKVIAEIERICRENGKKYFGPGAMSNFPDRYDGFHTYNRCCRKEQDKGRHSDNMKSYSKDRRAYEYWSDGNIHAANQFMGSDFFKGMSVDHIGPVSLGFIHDPHYLKRMKSSDNSSKNNKLLKDDIDLIIKINKKTGINPMSWQSQLIWDFIVKNYSTNQDKISTVYKNALQQNMINYMYVLWSVLIGSENGKDFLETKLLEPKYNCFLYSYSFDSKTGEIIEKSPRHFTERNQFELNRLKRIAINSVYEFAAKENRNQTQDLNKEEELLISKLCYTIDHDDDDYKESYGMLVKLMSIIQNRIIQTM